MKTRDEDYVKELCDRVLNRKGLRQHRFDFLLGDFGRNGRAGHRLPVDAYFRTSRRLDVNDAQLDCCSSHSLIGMGPFHCVNSGRKRKNVRYY
jgi:hypothetical protein